jgi:hypothetical protein
LKWFGVALYASDSDFSLLRMIDGFFEPFLFLPATSLKSRPEAAKIARASSLAFGLRSSSRPS